MQIVDLFLFSFLSIKTSPNESSNNIPWIKSDKYNRWYRALDILESFLIVKVAKLLVKADAAAAAAQKDKEILAETAVKAQEELFCPAITKLLQTHMTFAMDSPDFSQVSLQKIVIRKNNSMRIPLNPIFNSPILSSGRGKNDPLLQPDDIRDDRFAPLTCE